MKLKKSLLTLAIVLLLSMMLVTTSCSKYGKFKGDDYKTAWTKLNRYIIDNLDKEPQLGDIKEEIIIKAAVYEMVRRAENPDKKSSVETLSISKEKQITAGWDHVISMALIFESFVENFHGNIEDLIKLIPDTIEAKRSACFAVANYFCKKKEYSQAELYCPKFGLSEVEAYENIYQALSNNDFIDVAEGEESIFIRILEKSGKTKEEAREIIVGRIAFEFIGSEWDFGGNYSNIEPTKRKKMMEEKAKLYLKDEKKIFLLLGKRSLKVAEYDWAIEYFEKAGDMDKLKEAYIKFAKSFENKKDFENASKYYEKAGEKEKAAECRAK